MNLASVLGDFDIANGVWRRMNRRRIVVLMLLFAVCTVLPGVPRRPIALAVIGTSLVLALILDRIVPPRMRYLAWWAQLVAMSLAGATLIPEAWFASLVVVVTVGTWLRLGAERLPPWVLVGPGLGYLTVLALLRDPVAWEPTLVISVALTLLTGQLTRGMRVQLRENEDVLTHSLSTSASFIQISDLSVGGVASVTGPVEEITGWTADDWVEIDHVELIHPDDYADFWVTPTDVEPGETLERQARFRHRDGHWIWLRDVSVVLGTRSRGLYLRGITIDVTAIEEANIAARREAETDSLTRLPNRSTYLKTLAERLDTGETPAVMIIDLDRFKAINDTLGHAFGDSLLRELGDRLRRSAPPGCFVSRLGGDEFAIISTATTVEEAERMAARLTSVVTDKVVIDGVSIAMTLSLGIAVAGEHGTTVTDLMSHADMAMYEAKRQGHTIQLFNTEIRHPPLEEITLTASLREAIDTGQFVLHFQPKVDLTTGAVVGYEGLARWEHPELGLLSPNRFIHLVTWSEEGRDFADRVIELGAEFAAECRALNQPVPVSVNIAARSLFDDTLPERTARALERSGVPAELMTIEITESDIMDEAGRGSRVLERLAQLGLHISIDDFGTGYSSLSRLVDLPISEIKIDRRFVAGAHKNKSDAIIMTTIIDLADTLGLDVVAEGVEVPGDIERLTNAGCTQAQGFLFSKPLPPEEALGLLGALFDVGYPGPDGRSVPSPVAAAPADDLAA